MHHEEEHNISYRSLRRTDRNSSSIILPHYMIDKLNWKRQDNIKVQLEGDTLILKRVSLGPCHDKQEQEQQPQ
jgi:antitoxin component of MazEF toxin-antitoxin module